MFVPLHDGVPLRFMRTPYITYGLIGACLALQLMLLLWPGEEAELALMAGFGMIPSVLFGTAQLPDGLAHLPAWATLFSNILLHANLAHLVGNMLFLWVFGDNVEDAMGHARFLLFYLACGVIAGLFHAFMSPDSDLPLIGASGAVAGVIAAYLMLHPRVRVWVLAFKIIPLKLTAGLMLGLWVAFQVVMVALPEAGPVAWWAHIGGLIAGAVLILFMRRPGVPLFDRGVTLVA